ncbi:uncharacterized protein LOC144437514 [Glandiceps talaboti]
MATGSMEVDRRVWLYNLKDSLGVNFLDSLLGKKGQNGFNMVNDKTALITFDQKSDADRFAQEDRDEFRTAKCNMTLWKARADVLDKFSRFIEQLPTKQRQALNNTGAVRKRKLPNGVVLEGSLTSIQEFGNKLKGFIHSRYFSKDPNKKDSPGPKQPRNPEEDSLHLDDEMPNVLENICAEVAPWVYYFCPSIQSHIDSVQETAEVSISRKKDKLIVYGPTVEHMLRADSALSEFTFRGRSHSHDSPLTASHDSTSPRNDVSKPPVVMPSVPQPPVHHTSPEANATFSEPTGLAGLSKRKKKSSKKSAGGVPASLELTTTTPTFEKPEHLFKSPKPTTKGTDISKCLEELHFSMETTEGIQVTIHMGDITEQAVDVIVNSANSELQHGEGVALAISNHGGPIVQRESTKHVRKFGPLPVGSVCYTPSGNLPCKYVIHAVGPLWNEDESFRTIKESLHETILRALDMASQRFGAHSIALPAVSSGIHGMPVDLCAQIFHKAITEFSSSHKSTKLRDIRITINQRNSVGIFILEFYKAQEWSPTSTPTSSETSLIHPGDSTPTFSGHVSPSAAYASFHTDSSPLFVPKSKSTRPRSTTFEIDMSPPKSSPIGRSSVIASPSFRMTSLSSPSGDTSRLDLATKLWKRGDCQICTNSHVELLEMNCCKNTICETCFHCHFDNDGKCPFCFQVVLLKRGNQPDGKMNHRIERSKHLPGHKGAGTIVIMYDFPDGVQSGNHPNPGQPYTGTSRIAFLPASAKGQAVLDLLQRAFDNDLLFTIGRSVTTGIEDCIVWNDVHHKTSRTGGPTKHGYPDPTYLDRVMAELAAKGIK